MCLCFLELLVHVYGGIAAGVVVAVVMVLFDGVVDAEVVDGGGGEGTGTVAVVAVAVVAAVDDGVFVIRFFLVTAVLTLEREFSLLVVSEL